MKMLLNLLSIYTIVFAVPGISHAGFKIRNSNTKDRIYFSKRDSFEDSGDMNKVKSNFLQHNHEFMPYVERSLDVMKNSREFRELFDVCVTKFSECELPARNHSKETVNVAKDLTSKIQKGLQQFIEKEAKYCHEQKQEKENDYLVPHKTRDERMKRTIQQRFGSDVIIRPNGCTPKGTEQLGTLTLCHECRYRITLPAAFVERVHDVYLCDAQPTNPFVDDYSCLAGEGSCIEQQVIRNLLKRVTRFRRGNQFENVKMAFTTGCSCQIRTGSIFAAFAV